MCHKRLLLIVAVLVGISSQAYSMEKNAGNLYRAIERGNTTQLRDTIKNIPDFNPNFNYTMTGYMLPDGRFFIPPTTTAEFENRTLIEKTFCPFLLACEKSQLAIVRVLVEEYGADVNSSKEYSQGLAFTIGKAQPDMVRYLLSKGSKVNPAWIENGRKWLAENPESDPKYKNINQILYQLQGYKFVAGIAMTRTNIGIIAVGVTVAVGAGVWLYKRYQAKKKKHAHEQEENEQTSDEVKFDENADNEEKEPTNEINAPSDQI